MWLPRGKSCRLDMPQPVSQSKLGHYRRVKGGSRLLNTRPSRRRQRHDRHCQLEKPQEAQAGKGRMARVHRISSAFGDCWRAVMIYALAAEIAVAHQKWVRPGRQSKSRDCVPSRFVMPATGDRPQKPVGLPVRIRRSSTRWHGPGFPVPGPLRGRSHDGVRL